jgi:glycosyltransferase involved in cell wall biosynthesis
LSASADIVIVCGVGGSLFYNKFKRPIIITNVDGMEHLRKKYSVLQRMVIYLLQRLALKGSDYIVTDSTGVERYWKNRFNKDKRKVKMIAYGADDCLPFVSDILAGFGIFQNDYFLVIARLVPENNIHHIIDAFNHYLGSRKLVITGSLEDTSYVKKLMHSANDKVIFTDAIYEKNILDTLRTGCYVYIHGHSVGGTNPSLLEAMKAKCACICHDNIHNREVTDNSQVYFHSSGDLEESKYRLIKNQSCRSC